MKQVVYQNIIELLYFHECVIIPDFGGFVTSTVTARVDLEKGYFAPPEKKILFNHNLKNNDGLLISKIAESEKISYNDSKKLVSDFVRDLMNEITSGTFMFQSIGRFYFNSENQICFDPSVQKNFNTSAYGMSSFVFPVIHSYDTVRVIDKKFRDREAVRQIITQKNARRIMVGAPLLLILALLPSKTNFDLFSFKDTAGFNYHTTDIFSTSDKKESVDQAIFEMTRKQNALLYIEPSISKKEVQTPVTVDSALLLSAVEIPEVIPEKTERAKVEIQEKVSGPDVSARFHLIAGSFTEQYRADVYVKQLKSKGYNPVILPADKGRLRISIASFSNKDEADSKLDSMRNNADLSLWLLTKN